MANMHRVIRKCKSQRLMPMQNNYVYIILNQV